MCVFFNYICYFLIIAINVGFIANDIIRSETNKYEFRNKLYIVEKLMLDQNVKKKIRDVCIEFYNIFWHKRSGYHDQVEFKDLIPYPLYEQLVLDVCWIALKHSNLFKHMDLPFNRNIAVLMKSEFMLEGQVIFQKNEIKDKMIYISSGEVQIISEQDGDTPIMTFSCGTILGETSLFVSYNSGNTVRCKNFCEVLVLNKSDFIKIIKKYPMKYAHMRRIVETR